MLSPQRCKMCGRADGFNFNVPDDLWEQVVPPILRDHVVCLPCFDHLASARGIDYADLIDPCVHFAGQAASFSFTITTRSKASGLADCGGC